MATKSEELKIRLSIEQKQLIKEVAKAKGITMSELVLATLIPFVEKQNLNIEHRDSLEERIFKTEDKLSQIRNNMKNKRGNSKKIWWKK